MPADTGTAGIPELTFARTVDRTLVHRRNLSEVFLTDARTTGPGSFAAAALLPAAHPHYTTHAGAASAVLDPMLLLECARQAETYAAHAFYGIETGTAFILRRWSAEFLTLAADRGPAELTLTATTQNQGPAGGRIRSLSYEVTLWLREARAGQVSMDVAYATPAAYAALRSRRRDGPPPSSAEPPAVAAGRPVRPGQVGRLHATDTLLLDAVAGPDAVTAALRVPAENPSLFDHDQDHIPAMVLVEAARQLATLAAAQWGGGAAGETTMVAMEAGFSAYAELDVAVAMTAVRPGSAASPVEVTFHQGGAEITRAVVTIGPVPDVPVPDMPVPDIPVRRAPARGPAAITPGVPAAVLAGLGAWTPAAVVTNEELADVLGVDETWIEERTGVRQRHVVAPGESTGDLAVEAGRRALESAGVTDAGAVILATSTPDRLCPATAPEVASRLGLGEVPAFDVAAVCAGFLYALAAGSGLIAAGTTGSVLIIGADAFSTILDPADRSTRAVFGDGAGAVLLRAGSGTEDGALQGLSLGSDGSLGEIIGIPAGGSRQRSAGLPAKIEDTYLQMEGRAAFSHAVRRMSASILHTAQRTGWPLDQIEWFVLHQANARILAATAKRLDVPPGRFLSNIGSVGNTAAASIPLALADGVASGQLRPGQRVVLASFGGGLAWGSAALTWPGITKCVDKGSGE